MKDYKNTIPIASTQTYNDIYVGVTNKHATNMATASLLYCGAFVVVCGILYLVLYSSYALFLLPLPFAMYIKAKYLVEFTNEARDILFEQYTNQQEIVTQQIKDVQIDKSYTVISAPNGKDKIVLHLALTQSQLEQIKNTALQTKTLTVNYLESLGLSRPNAEKLRVELVQHNLLTMDDNGRVQLTKSGRRALSRI